MLLMLLSRELCLGLNYGTVNSLGDWNLCEGVICGSDGILERSVLLCANSLGGRALEIKACFISEDGRKNNVKPSSSQ